MEQKPTPSKRYARFIELADQTGIAGEPLGENQAWQERIKKIIDFLPEQTVSGLVKHMQTTLNKPVTDTESFVKTHRLTPAETKLLLSLSNGISVPKHAKKLGISVNTGRVHMQRILDKTGANGQLDLIKMLHKR